MGLSSPLSLSDSETLGKSFLFSASVSCVWNGANHSVCFMGAYEDCRQRAENLGWASVGLFVVTVARFCLPLSA